jgi:muramoyltetrapeptide carboxypeptidase
VHVKTGLVTFHSPLGRSDWNAFSVEHFQGRGDGRRAAHAAQRPLAGDDPVPAKAVAPRCAAAGARAAAGRQPGGADLAGRHALLPRPDGAILFLEDVNEYIYRVDRMLSPR